MIDVQRRKTTLVVMRVPECKLLASMRRAERVVDVENLQLARLHARAELIKQSRRQPLEAGIDLDGMQNHGELAGATFAVFAPELPAPGSPNGETKPPYVRSRGPWA